MSHEYKFTGWRRAALMATVAAVAFPAAAAEKATDFHIAAQPMQSALNALSQQSGMRLLYPYDQVAGLRSPAVTGRMSTRDALQKIIERSPLRVAIMQDGLIALAAPSGPALIRTSAPGVGAAVEAVQADPVAAPAEAPQEVEELVVTGARGAARTVIKSATPIDVLGSAELERTGRAGVFQAMQTLVPSFNLPARAGGGTSTVISTGGLRGLNPDQTLVLVNGKRRHKTSLINSVSSLYNGSVPADLDLIPTSSIGRIEVLRDGAAAQYGSDAIAGVINIILKETPGGSVSVTHGQNFDRNDGKFTQVVGNYGLKLGDKGFLNLSVSTKDQALSNRAIPVADSIQIYPKIGTAADPREATVDRLVTRNYGVLPQWGVNLGYNGHYEVGEVELYSFGTYSKRVSDLPFTFRAPNSVNALPQVYPEGFRPDLVIREQDFDIAFGARGTFHGWSWDASSTYGKNLAKERVSESINASLGPNSPTSFYVGKLVSSEWVNSIDVTRGFNLANGGDVQVSFGGQYRHETYQVGEGEPLSYAAGTYVIPTGQPFAGQRPATGAQAAPGFQPSDASKSKRNNYAAYGEVGYTQGKLFLGAAVRYEDYDDASGDTVVGKVNGRYELTDWLAVRGAVSTGFRAPGLAQENYAASSSQFRLVGGVLDLLQIKTLPVGSKEAIALGAKPLTPETSKNYSLGVTLEPLPRLSVTLDAYQIDVDDRIAITSTLTGTAVSNILAANGLASSLSAQYYTNAIDTRTRGVDLVATYRQDLGAYGSLRVNLGYNHNETKITHIIDNPSQLAALGSSYVLFDRLSQGYLTKAFPKDKIALGANWSWDKLNVNLRNTRYGGYEIEQNTVANDRSYGPKWITDLEASYRVTQSVTATVGANNLFNVYPSANGVFNATIGSGQYPGTSPIGFTGGSYYVRLQWDF